MAQDIDECSVCVAVHVRPLIQQEEDEGCKPCLDIAPGEPQVAAGPHSFRYDYVFGGSGGQPSSQLYSQCVGPLVDGLFKGYNATVFAYGQTGSGKTYTMGSAFTPGGSTQGVIPQAMEAIFDRVSRARDVDFTVRVGFVEIHKEEIRDLLMTDAAPHPQVSIREVVGGGICLAGANEREVRTKEQMVEILQQGTLLRATAATGMNKRSSRSHAIFTITLEQRKLVPPATADAAARRGGGGRDEGGVEEEEDGESDEEEADEGDDSYLVAKLHLVDLAGSERAKRTKAEGQRLQEGININKGLLALGNVICALSEGKQHVPYRDSKLTRMLQDSLGGNSRTLMIACVSPADVNLEETLNTLRYANRARNIRNKPVVNRDPVAAQLAHLRQQLAAARAENQSLKRKLGIAGDGGGASEGLFGSGQDLVMAAALEELEQRNKRLDMDCNRLRVEAESLKQDLKETTEKMIVAQAQRDRLSQKLEQVDPVAAGEAKASLDQLSGGGAGGDEVVSHLQRIAELEREVKRLRQVSRVSGAFVVNSRRQSLALDGAAGALPGSPFALRPAAPSEDGSYLSDLELHDDEFAAEEQAHKHEMTRVQAQIALLQQQLEEKEARMHVVGSHALMKQAYDKQLKELQHEVEELQRERLKLLQDLQSLQHVTEEERLKMEVQYKARLKSMDEKLKSLRSKEKRILDLERIKGKAEEACKRLQTDIQNIKQQKVTLMKQAERSAREFAEWKKQRDKELLQLRKQGRANAAQLQKMEALHEKQQAVLRRKTEEAEAARKRLKEMESRRSNSISRPSTAASDRHITAPAFAAAASGAAAAPARPAPAGLAVERSASVPGGPLSVDCQPNQMAPLLRDEKSRREWVESELDACCASYDLQRVVEGEKALRSECARKLRDVEKKLASLKNPGWWPVSASPGSQSEQALLRQKQELHRQLDAHSKQIQEYQLQLMRVKQSEEERGGGAADARRWNGLRTIVEARAMLKTVFRSASQHKAQAYEVQLQMTEATEEVELLRLRLDIAEQEKLESANLVAQAQAAVAAMAASSSSPTPQPQAARVPKDDTDALADTLIQELHALPSNPLETIPEEALSPLSSVSSEDEEEEEEEEESSSDEEGDAWDPSLATPCVKRKKAAQAVHNTEQQGRRRSSTAAGRRSSAGGHPGPEEQPVLSFINEERARAGEEPISKLTVPILKRHLRGKRVGGQEWRAGGKKREDLVRDFRELLGLRPTTPASPPAARGPPEWHEGAKRSSLQVQIGDAGHIQASSSTSTPVGAEGLTPDALPNLRPGGLSASPPQGAGAAAPQLADGSLGALAVNPAEAHDAGNSPGSGKSSDRSSPMQRLLALNPFARHGRGSQPDAPPPVQQRSSSGGSGSSGSGTSSAGGPRSQPGATPSSSATVGAAALLEKSAACMQRAAEMRTQLQLNTSMVLSSASRPSSTSTSPTGAQAAALDSARGGAGSARASPTKTLLNWMGIAKPRGQAAAAAAAAKEPGSAAAPGGAWSIAVDGSSAGGPDGGRAAGGPFSPRQPLGVSNRSSGASAHDDAARPSAESENSSSGGSASGSRPSSALSAAASKGITSRAGRASSGTESHSPMKPPPSRPQALNSARGSPIRAWK